MAKDYLWQRGKQWYLRLPVPKPLRSRFLSGTGKPIVQIVQPLGSSYEYAKLEHDRRVAKYRELFARLHAGEQLTPEQIKTAMSFDKAAEGKRLYQEALTALRTGVDADTVFGGRLDTEAEELVRRGETDPDTARRVALIAKLLAVNARSAELLGPLPAATPALPVPAAGGATTISQAAEAWLKEMTQDKDAAPRQSTIEGHRQRVQVFIDAAGDVALTEVTRAKAADFLAGLKISNRTRNIYATTLKCVFESARKRGRFTGENPFAGQRSKVAKNHKVRYTVDELQTLFDKLPREVAPKKHTPDTAVPWVALIAAYSGACLEEICKLTVADIREEGVNGGRFWCISIHNGNGDGQDKVKNDVARPRLLPIHSAVVKAGLLDYIANLPSKRGQLFPGLQRRASKDNKFGPRVGELYNKKLRKLGIKRKGLDFHSFRHTVSNVLEIAGVSQTDAARVLGHSIEGMSYGTYSQPGPGLVRVKDLVEKIKYEGLRL
jgi:integrase